MAVRFYDGNIDQFRDVTQADWDLLFGRVVEKHRAVGRLQAVLAEHNIPLPVGMAAIRDGEAA